MNTFIRQVAEIKKDKQYIRLSLLRQVETETLS